MAAELLFSGQKQRFGRSLKMGAGGSSVYRSRLIKAEWKGFGGVGETIRKKMLPKVKKHL
jgi:hypothetical protein